MENEGLAEYCFYVARHSFVLKAIIKKSLHDFEVDIKFLGSK